MKVTFSRYSSIILILLIFLFSEGTSVFAQTEEDLSNNLNWINVGLGFSSLGAIGGCADFNFQFKKLMFSLHATVNSEKSGILAGGDEFFDTGLLIGIATQSQENHASISVGIARVTGSRYKETTGGFFGGKRVDIDPTIGFPIGLNIYLNLNKEETFGGITLSLIFGKLL